ncbi:MAG: hypothetical protein IJ060_05070 [Oscillospiraceae bacterium]|nr:hypothetical protein [Oscillospiraceae bacterium]
MSRIAKLNLRYTAMLAAVYVLRVLTDRVTYFTSVLFGFCVLLWGYSVRERLPHRRMRGNLFGMAAMLSMMFPLRICRWMLLDPALGLRSNDALTRFLWYLSYVPSNSAPLFSLAAALSVGTEETARRPRILLPCWAVTALLTLLTLTNNLHELMFRFTSPDGSYDYGILYWIVTIWSVLLMLAAYVILLRRCRLSQCRKRWYLPTLAGVLSFSLLVWYMLLGGQSPEIGSFRLFYYQEAYALVFLAVWEECIVIGLVPSNSGYRELFAVSHLNALLQSHDGSEQVVSHAAPAPEPSESIITRSHPVSGGTVTWNEDRTAIRRINREIENAVERIEEENDLITEETNIAAKRLGLEMQNRLYDSISVHCRAQIEAIGRELQGDAPLTERLPRCLKLGTYVKRSANLILTGTRNGVLSGNDLMLSVREMFSNLAFSGTVCELRGGESRDCPAGEIIAAFDLLEAILAQPALHTCSVQICPDRDTLLIAEYDAEPLPQSSLPAALRITQTAEDGVTCLRMRGAP